MNWTEFYVLAITYYLLFAVWIFTILYGIGWLSNSGEPDAMCCAAAIACLLGNLIIEKLMNTQTEYRFKAFAPVGGFLLASVMAIFAAWVRF